MRCTLEYTNSINFKKGVNRLQMGALFFSILRTLDRKAGVVLL